MGRWIRRLAIGLLLVAALYLPLAGIGVAALANWLLTPGNVDWSGARNPAPADPFELGYRGDPEQALGLSFETVTYATELGDAEAWLVPAEAASPLWAVYVHGVGGIRENGYRQLSILQEAGIPTLMITYRNDAGAPSAANPLYSFGLNEWKDLDAAVTWTLGQGVERIILVAESMGGGIAGQFLLHSAQRDRVAALALDAPALDFPAVLEARAAAFNMPFAATLGAIGAWGLSTLRGTDMSKAIVMPQVEAFPGPIFIAHGAADSLVPVSISDRLSNARASQTVYLRTGADHLLSYKENPDSYRAAMLDWLMSLPR